MLRALPRLPARLVVGRTHEETARRNQNLARGYADEQLFVATPVAAIAARPAATIIAAFLAVALLRAGADSGLAGPAVKLSARSIVIHKLAQASRLRVAQAGSALIVIFANQGVTCGTDTRVARFLPVAHVVVNTLVFIIGYADAPGVRVASVVGTGICVVTVQLPWGHALASRAMVVERARVLVITGGTVFHRGKNAALLSVTGIFGALAVIFASYLVPGHARTAVTHIPQRTGVTVAARCAVNNRSMYTADTLLAGIHRTTAVVVAGRRLAKNALTFDAHFRTVARIAVQADAVRIRFESAADFRVTSIVCARVLVHANDHVAADALTGQAGGALNARIAVLASSSVGSGCVVATVFRVARIGCASVFIVTRRILRHVQDHVLILIAEVFGAFDAVVGGRCDACQALAGVGIAGFLTVAKETVAALFRRSDALPFHARVVLGAHVAVIARTVRRDSNAPFFRVTDVFGANISVVADSVDGSVYAPFRRLAVIISAIDAVIAIARRSIDDSVGIHQAGCRLLVEIAKESTVAQVPIFDGSAVVIVAAHAVQFGQLFGRQHLTSTSAGQAHVGAGAGVSVVARRTVHRRGVSHALPEVRIASVRGAGVSIIAQHPFVHTGACETGVQGAQISVITQAAATAASVFTAVLAFAVSFTAGAVVAGDPLGAAQRATAGKLALAQARVGAHLKFATFAAIFEAPVRPALLARTIRGAALVVDANVAFEATHFATAQVDALAQPIIIAQAVVFTFATITFAPVAAALLAIAVRLALDLAFSFHAQGSNFRADPAHISAAVIAALHVLTVGNAIGQTLPCVAVLIVSALTAVVVTTVRTTLLVGAIGDAVGDALAFLAIGGCVRAGAA